MEKNVITALILTTAAGLSTTIGSILGLFLRKPGPRFMSATLGFSAGIMLMVSFAELLQEGIKAIGFLSAHIGFFAGILGMFLIDVSVPHDYIGQHDRSGTKDQQRLIKTGLFLALGIGIHNFPEGMVTFAGAMEDLNLGTAIAFAIAIHNIPEGLAISIPVYAATGSRQKAFLWSFLSGIAEPIGAIIAAAFLVPILTQSLLGWMLAIVAGIMVFISLDELLPVSRSFGIDHLPILGAIAGMAVMTLSIWILR